MWLFSSRLGVRSPRMVAAVTVLSATLLLVAPSFVSGAPVDNNGLHLINKEVPYLPEGSSSENDVDVQELHSLNQIDQQASVLPEEVGVGQQTSQQTNEEAEKRSTENKSEFVLSDFTSSTDTPRDMAEYIFWTGDETSVTSAIKDFVDQGLMSAEDGKEFMEEVRYDLHQIQLRYGTDKTDVVSDKTAKFIPKEEENDDESHQLSELAHVNKLAPLEINGKPHAGEIVVTTYDPKNKSKNEYTPERDRLEEEIRSKGATTNQVKEEHFDEAHIVDLLSNEYTLEEIIYQLARILFSQSLSQAGHPEAEEALKKFADFLEKESKEGKMSPQVQRKVLDVLLMSLFDAMGDQGHQHLSSSPPNDKRISQIENQADGKH